MFRCPSQRVGEVLLIVNWLLVSLLFSTLTSGTSFKLSSQERTEAPTADRAGSTQTDTICYAAVSDTCFVKAMAEVAALGYMVPSLEENGRNFSPSAAVTDSASEPSTSGTDPESQHGSGNGYIYHKVCLAFCCTDIVCVAVLSFPRSSEHNVLHHRFPREILLRGWPLNTG